MTRAYHRAEGIANGTAITTSNTGGSAGTAFSSTFGSPVASTTQVAHGTRSMSCTLSAQTSCGGRDTTAIGTQTVIRGRLYVWLTALPAANMRIAQALSSSTLACGVGFSSTGKLRLNDSASAQMAVGTATVPTGQWVRIEWRMVASATTGQASASVWFSADSTGAPDDTISSTATFNTLASFSSYDIGALFSAGQTYGPMYVDEAVWDTTDTAIGPYVDPQNFSFDFESGLGAWDSTSNPDRRADAALFGSWGVRLDSRTTAASLTLGNLAFGPGLRWASIRAWMRLPLGITGTDNVSLMRVRNTDPSGSGGGGNADIWVDQADGKVKGDLMPTDFFNNGPVVGSEWFLMRVVVAYKDDGTSSMKVKVGNTEFGPISSTLPVVGEALASVIFGAGTVVSNVIDIDQVTITVSDATLDYLGPALTTLTLGQATQTATATALAGRAKSRTLTQPVETDTGQLLTRTKRRSVGQPAEADSALPLVPPVPVIPDIIAVETLVGTLSAVETLR